MKILALDTSTEYCSVALMIGDEIDLRETLAGQRHSELVLGMIDELLTARNLRLGELDGIAYGHGPGSFTGLRIACGVVQGLAFGADVRVVGIDTLLAMAAGTGARRVVCCVDARVHEIYHAAYDRIDDKWRTVTAPTLCAPGDAPALHGEGWLACGNGFSAYREALVEHYGAQLSSVEPDRFPSAREIARLSVPHFAAGHTLAPENASPVYLRDKVALRTDERGSP